MKMFKTLLVKITIAILLTVSISIAIIAIISSLKIEQGFTNFIEQQSTEVYGFGYGKNQKSEEKAQRHQQLIGEFQTTVNQSIFIASIAGIIGSLIIGLVLSKQISNPLKLLNNKLNSARKNNYESLDFETNTSEVNDLVTSYNQLISELKRIELLREDLVSDVTHELKTPLTKIVGQVEGCIDGVYKCDNQRLEQILGSARQLEALISRLQELVELKAGKAKLNIKEINLYEFVNGLLEGYPSTDIELINTIEPTVTINADAIKFHEILENLINNGIKHTKKGSVSIYFKNHSLYIKDTGEGIPTEDLPYIFERFYRSDKSRNKETGGLGLGLSIVKELVNLHGWSISVESEIDKGTTFTILFK